MLPQFLTRARPKRTIRRREVPSARRDVFLTVIVTSAIALAFVYGAVAGWAGIVGLTLMGLGLYLVIGSNYSERRYIQSQWSITDICEHMALTEQQAREYIARRAITPTYTLSGEHLYYPLDIIESIKLLRPAEGAVGLLHAAQAAPSAEESLVRPFKGGKK